MQPSRTDKLASLKQVFWTENSSGNAFINLNTTIINLQSFEFKKCKLNVVLQSKKNFELYFKGDDCCH